MTKTHTVRTKWAKWYTLSCTFNVFPIFENLKFISPSHENLIQIPSWVFDCHHRPCDASRNILQRNFNLLGWLREENAERLHWYPFQKRQGDINPGLYRIEQLAYAFMPCEGKQSILSRHQFETFFYSRMMTVPCSSGSLSSLVSLCNSCARMEWVLMTKACS